MPTSEEFHKLFSQYRLFPSNDYHRPVIEGLLAQLAFMDSSLYEVMLQKYNEKASEQGVPLFGRVVVEKHTEEPEVTEVVVPEEAPETEELTGTCIDVVDEVVIEPEVTEVEPLDEDEEKEELVAMLQDAGVRASSNWKLETLRKKAASLSQSE